MSSTLGQLTTELDLGSLAADAFSGVIPTPLQTGVGVGSLVLDKSWAIAAEPGLEYEAGHLAAALGSLLNAELAMALPDPDTWVLADLSNWQRSPEGLRRWDDLAALLDQCELAAGELSDEITRLHFSHVDRRTI